MDYKNFDPKVQLLHHTPLWVDAKACRACWDSHDKSDNGGEKDKELIYRVGNKFKHGSIKEHLVYNFYISDISRGCLQELARHRMSSFSVKSTRYTLKELKKEVHFDNDDFERVSKYVILTGNRDVDEKIYEALENLRQLIVSGFPNDVAKYALPEAYKTELAWTINARSLQNFLELRTNKAALPEIRALAYKVFEAIPEDHKYLFEEFLYLKEN